MSEQDAEQQGERVVADLRGGGARAIPDWVFWLIPVLVALLLRHTALELNSLSHDELSTWARTEYSKVRGVIEYGVKPDYHPPGHFLLIWGVKQLGWESAYALRLPSVLASVLSVGFMYRIGRDLYDRWTGSMAALLMSVNWACVYYAQDARAYAFLILFGLMSVDASIRIVRSFRSQQVPSALDWIQLILAGAAGAYVHYYGLFFVGLLGIGCLLVLVRQPKAALKTALGFLGILVLYGPWIPILFDDLGHSKTWVVRHGVEFFPRWWGWLFGNADVPARTAAAVVALGGWAMVVRKGDKSANIRWATTGLVIAWLVMPGMVAFVKSLLSTPALTNRNILPSAPAAFLLIAVAVRHFPGKSVVQALVFAGILGTSVWDLVVVKSYYQTPTKEEYRDAVKAVAVHAPDALFARCGIKAHFAYYLKQYGSEAEIDKNLCREEHLEGFKERNTDRALSFVRVHYKPEQVVLDHLDDTYLTSQVFKARDAVGMLLRPRVSEPPPAARELDEPEPSEDVELGDEAIEADVEACGSDFPPLNRIGAWSVWPYRPGLLMDTLDSGVRLRRSTEDDARVLMCMRGRQPVSGAVHFSGKWLVGFGEGGGTAQISARYFGSDKKWVSGTELDRPVWVVKTSKTSIEMTEFDKVYQAPPAAESVQLCLVLTGAESLIELHDACVEAAP